MTASSVNELLEQNQTSDLLRLTTAGSVDDGKSTLIGRLLYDSKGIYEDQLSAVESASRSLNREEVDLALLMDGLKSEREQGITIDVAYRYFSTPKRRFIIADTPGHEQYTRNMATGASTANLAIVLIDARKGVLVQSRRHGFIASLLGIPHMVVAVNKMDLVDYDQDTFENFCSDYREFAGRLNVHDITFIPISALKGDNVVNSGDNMPWYDGPTLLSHLENVYIGSDRNLVDFRFPVQMVLRPNQEFRGYAGQVASGVIRPGEEVVALPSGRKSRVKSIHNFDGDLSHAYPPLSVTLTLEDELDISRGDMLAHPANLPYIEREVEAMLIWMSDEPFNTGKPYMIKHTTNTVKGQFTRLEYAVDPKTLNRKESTRLELNEIGRVMLELFTPIIYDEYSRNRTTGSFIVIDPMSNGTVGAGMIIERGRHRGKPAASEVPVSRNITRHKSTISTEERQKLLGQKPATIWLTGLSGSGKSTIGYAVERALVDMGRACMVLDGDNVRHGLNRDLGFSAEDRTENIRRIAETAHLFNDAGLFVITSFISPYRQDRQQAREVIGEERFVEVFVDTSLDVCESRDPKGLYQKARAGEIQEFTGISAPYEKPEKADLVLAAGSVDVDACARAILAMLEGRGLFLPLH